VIYITNLWIDHSLSSAAIES